MLAEFELKEERSTKELDRWTKRTEAMFAIFILGN